MRPKSLYVTSEAYGTLLNAIEDATGQRAVYNSWNDDFNGWWTIYFGCIQIEFKPGTASFSGANIISFYRVDDSRDLKRLVSFMSVKDELPKKVVDVFLYNLELFDQDIFQ